eukprot:CAMPEP_0197046044 /NCGR_PEP_ID=MMETSP1384-20130603/21809_1 /TAXON_ID=29189 /ORGANISM="Ammonia sp." /LENGTH=336 /DNA_ID=CAMNT_0042477753 /DNA_START=31 /DNA_END=1041 /DNA_ORIENTATION=-
MSHPPCFFANNLIYCIVQIIFIVFVVVVTAHLCVECRKASESSSKSRTKLLFLFVLGVVYNAVTVFCALALFLKSLPCILPHGSIDADMLASIHLFLPCNLIYLQNTILVIVVFFRIDITFADSPFNTTKRVRIAFSVCFAVSLTIFVGLLLSKIQIPGTDSWLNCAVTLCIFNIFFAVWLTAIFLSKFASLLRNVDTRDNSLISMISKTTLLSCISFTVTIISCTLVLFRYSVFGDNELVNAVSEWMVALNVYCNFLCYTLVYIHYDKHYQRLCKPLDVCCKKAWAIAIFGSYRDAERSMKILMQLDAAGDDAGDIAANTMPEIVLSPEVMNTVD